MDCDPYFKGFSPEFDDVYAAIARSLRSKTTPMTKRKVATVHKKMLAGEVLEEGQEQNIGALLLRQLAG